MNYFAHGIRFVSDPYFLAGTAIPDWMSAIDRRVRFRKAAARRDAGIEGLRENRVAAGIVQHLHDDDLFHRNPHFSQAVLELTCHFVSQLGSNDGFRCGLLAHVGLELLLDAALAEKYPERLNDYYDALADVDVAVLERAIGMVGSHPTSQLSWFVPLFQREQFLRDYLSNARLAIRLQQIWRRVKLPPLPDHLGSTLPTARAMVTGRLDLLLSPEFFNAIDGTLLAGQ